MRKAIFCHLELQSLLLACTTAVFPLIITLFLFTPHAFAQESTPTPDRLAAPPTVVAPSQADDGAQLYWLHCQPCHGDQGQGLTDAPDDDWRAQYPPEDQNCWNSGCHGNRPYEEGFTLPKSVPAVIGEETLSRFETMSELFEYVHTAMPFQAANSLETGEYLAITAFLAQQHAPWEGTPLTEKTLTEALMQPLPAPTLLPTPTALPAAPASASENGRFPLWLSATLLGGLMLGGIFLWQRQAR